MKFIDYICQDFKARDKDFSIIKTLWRVYRIPGYKLLLNYRIAQYYLKFSPPPYIYVICQYISRLRLERLSGKYCFSITEQLQSKSGLSFPHNGPCVINSSAIIGHNCTIHPNVLIGGDRGKGAPVIGDNVFIGNGAKIIGNCNIGSWVFIAPGAVITKDVPDGSVVGFGLNNILNSDGRRHVKMYL